MGKTRLKVGLFVTLSFFLLAGAILWLAGSRFLQPVDTYNIYFTKSVSGLLPGAAVEYQGVTVGKVESLRLTEETPPRARVTIALQPGTPVRRNTIAHLIGSFVTGIRFIELRGGSANFPLQESGGTIFVREGGLEEFRDKASEIAERLLNTLTRIERDLLNEQNSQAITTVLQNIAELTENLRASIDAVATPQTRLEQFSFRCIEAIAGGADIVSTLGRREGREGRPHRRPQGGHRARRNGPQAGFEFGKDVFNRIEVGAVGGQVEQVRPSGLDRGAHASHFMAGQIVHHDPVARVEGGDEHLFDIGHKAGAIDWAVQDRRGGEAIRS